MKRCHVVARAIGLITAQTILISSSQSFAQEQDRVLSPVEAREFTLDQLMNARIYSVSKKTEKLSTAASAITVITEEDIRRSGVNNIPDALRLVPGMQVGRVDSETWAISARGFNNVFANKLLVLQDGRSIYTPLFSGVFWDEKDTLLEDLDRIEVIRGPGATLWGANAVNGVVNIITKPADETQGWLATAGGGSEDRAMVGARYGGKLSDNAYYRVYGKYANHDSSETPNGGDAQDSWQMGRGGFRTDWKPTDQNLFTFEAEGYGGKENQTFIVPANPTVLGSPGSTLLADDKTVAGGNVLSRWTHSFSENSDFRLQTYYDTTRRVSAVFEEKRDTADVDFQHRFPLGDRNDILWGAGYRFTHDNIGNTPIVALNPDERTIHLFNTFLQDEIELVRDRVHLTLGTKVEYNSYTHFELQPGGRLAWTPNDNQTVWGSISRAVRTPSRAEREIMLHQVGNPPAPPVNIEFDGSSQFESEKMMAYELGYRWKIHKRLSTDLALFYNEYDDLRSIDPTASPVVFTLGNKRTGEAYGVEFAPAWQPVDWWRLQAAYSYLQIQIHHDTSRDPDDERRNPHHQFTFRSVMDLPHNVQFDSVVRYVDSLPAWKIPSYVALDLRLAWWPTKNLEIAIIGRDLLDNRHPESVPSNVATLATEVERSVFGKITWRF